MFEVQPLHCKKLRMFAPLTQREPSTSGVSTPPLAITRILFSSQEVRHVANIRSVVLVADVSDVAAEAVPAEAVAVKRLEQMRVCRGVCAN